MMARLYKTERNFYAKIPVHTPCEVLDFMIRVNFETI